MSDNFLKIHKGVGLAPQAAEPANPSNGDIYYDSSLNVFRKYENGAWSNLSSGGLGFTYVKNSDAEVDTSNTAASGGPGAVTITRQTTNPLRGAASFDCVFGSGAGTSDFCDFDLDVIELADDSGSLSVRLDYSTENTISTGNFEVVLWNSTDSIAEILGDLAATGDFLNPSGFVSVAKDIDITKTYKLRLRPKVAFGTSRTVRMDTIIINNESFIPGIAEGSKIKYATNAGQSIANNAPFVVIDFEDKLHDDRGLVTTGASWNYVVPRDGYYDVSLNILFASTTGWASNESISLGLFVNGTIENYLDRTGGISTSGGANFIRAAGNTTVKLLKGDVVDLRITQNIGSALTLHTDNKYNFVTINEHDYSAGLISTTENLFKNARAKVSFPTTQSITQNTDTVVQFSTVTYDKTSLFRSGTYDFLIQEDGQYNVDFCVAYATSGSNSLRRVDIQVNGTKAARFQDGPITTTTTYISGSAPLDLVKGDIVRLVVRHDAAGALNISGPVDNTFMSISRIQDTSVFSVSGETEVLSSANTTFASVGSPVLDTWYTPLSSWNLPIKPGTWDINIKLLYDAISNTSNSQILPFIAISTSPTPGSGIIEVFTNGYHGGNSAVENGMASRTLNATLKNYTTTTNQTLYIQLRARNAGSSTGLSVLRFRSEINFSGFTDHITAVRKK